MEALFDDPVALRWIGGLADLGRLVLFDRCGIGLSDPPPDSDHPTFARWSRDIEAVVAAARWSSTLGSPKADTFSSAPRRGTACVRCFRTSTRNSASSRQHRPLCPPALSCVVLFPCPGPLVGRWVLSSGLLSSLVWRVPVPRVDEGSQLATFAVATGPAGWPIRLWLTAVLPLLASGGFRSSSPLPPARKRDTRRDGGPRSGPGPRTAGHAPPAGARERRSGLLRDGPA
jgi:hypothetical protein